jgi:Na+-translocating ferredoxin:NAD+ oxidoreductase RnfD subunit
MSAPALAAPGGRALQIRGTAYPVFLPSVRDPRLHLAAVIFSLHALGQVAFDFRVSIAQIMVALGTCAALESSIEFARRRVIMWPASALITGNGVAFVLRLPGTRHGDWWSLRGWYFYAGAAAVGLLSKHVIRFGGRHIFNPSNFGLVLTFLIFREGRAEPLDFWWGPMDAWMIAALAIIVCGGLAILNRLKLLPIAVTFWVTFAAGIGVIAAAGHAMSARWHVGPVTGFSFWWILVTSPEILVFLFFMLTDPKTIPSTARGRIAYAVTVGVLATLLIAPARTEFWSKVAVLGALLVACAGWPALKRWGPRFAPRRTTLALAGAGLLALYGGGLVAAGIPARPDTPVAPLRETSHLPTITIGKSKGVSQPLIRKDARRIAADLVRDLRLQARALISRDPKALELGATFARLPELQKQIRAARGKPIVVPTYRLDSMDVHYEAGSGQGAAIAVASLAGSEQLTTYDTARPSMVVHREQPTRYAERLTNVAPQVGLRFRQGDFRFGTSYDVHSMMGGGLCWLDYNNDGRLDLFAVNSYSDADVQAWDAGSGLPRSALFENVGGHFVDVGTRAKADLAVQGNGCVAGDLNGDGRADLLVTTNTYNVLLWNNGDGTFTDGTHAAGIDAFGTFGWHTGAAVADVNGDERPDVFVSGYADVNAPSKSPGGFPLNYQAFHDLLYLNQGTDAAGHSRFRDVALDAGIERRHVDHSLGAVFTDVNGDGRPDLYVANDLDPNRLYVNLPGGPLGFHFVEEGNTLNVADRNAGMGVAAQDYSGDGRSDLFVTNSRTQGHAAFRSNGLKSSFTNAGSVFARAIGPNGTGWGDSWIDLANNGRLDLVLTNGAIPVTNLKKDAGRIQVLVNLGGRFADASAAVGLQSGPVVNGRGLAAADYDNDGRVDFAVNSIGGRLMLFHNTGAEGNWLEVSLIKFSPGARVTAVLPDGRSLVREVQAGSSYLSSEDPRIHFGLGGVTRLKALVVRWPDGTVTRGGNVLADRIVTVAP